ncbi:hypothetical protein D3C73_610240 [compost metagenome]
MSVCLGDIHGYGPKGQVPAAPQQIRTVVVTDKCTGITGNQIVEAVLQRTLQEIWAVTSIALLNLAGQQSVFGDTRLQHIRHGGKGHGERLFTAVRFFHDHQQIATGAGGLNAVKAKCTWRDVFLVNHVTALHHFYQSISLCHAVNHG